jgi:hypothetical protein
LLLIPSHVNASLQEDEVILEVTNYYLPSGGSYIKEIIMEPFAPHMIVSSISKNDSSIIEAIVTVSIEKEEGSGLTMLHRGDRPIADHEWTPTDELFTVTVFNSGLLGDITFNLTITQIGSAITHFPELDVTLGSYIVLILVLSIVPIPILFGVLFVYRRQVIEGGN